MMNYIIERADFIKDEDLKKKYSQEIKPIPQLERNGEVKLLKADEKVLSFDEFVKRKKKS